MTKRIPCLFSKLRIRGRECLVPGAVLLFSACIGAVLPARALAEELASIDWLQKDMSCDDLTLQMKERYGKLGSYAELPEAKKQEIGLVLDIICGARFAKCNFRNCARLAPASGLAAASPVPSASPAPSTGSGAALAAASPAPSVTAAGSALAELPPAAPDHVAARAPESVPQQPIDYRAEAKKLLEARIQKQEELMRKGIEEAQARESAGKRAWMKVSVVSEEPAPADEVVEEELPAEPTPTPRGGAKKEPKKTGSPAYDRRHTANSFVAPASPVRAMLDLTPESTQPEGKRIGYLAKSDARFHQIQVATVPTKVNIPGGNNFGSGQ